MALTVGIPALLAVACHLNGLGGAFVFDDISAVVKNGDVVHGPTLSAFSNNFWGEPMGKASSSHESYRPLVVLTFAINYIFAGEADSGSVSPVGFHIVNIAIHAATACALTLLAKRLLSKGWSSDVSACIAGSLFAVHPIHVEAVIGIVGRCELMAGLFYVAAVLKYASAISGGGWSDHAAACACIATSVLCKEQVSQQGCVRSS